MFDLSTFDFITFDDAGNLANTPVKTIGGGGIIARGAQYAVPEREILDLLESIEEAERKKREQERKLDKAIEQDKPEGVVEKLEAAVDRTQDQIDRLKARVSSLGGIDRVASAGIDLSYWLDDDEDSLLLLL